MMYDIYQIIHWPGIVANFTYRHITTICKSFYFLRSSYMLVCEIIWILIFLDDFTYWRMIHKSKGIRKQLICQYVKLLMENLYKEWWSVRELKDGMYQFCIINYWIGKFHYLDLLSPPGMSLSLHVQITW